MLGQTTPVDRNDDAVDGALALVGFHEHTGAAFHPEFFKRLSPAVGRIKQLT
jgi:hypothetical protein